MTEPALPPRTKTPTPPWLPVPWPGRAVACCPGAKVGYSFGEQVEFLRGDDCSGVVGEKGVEAGRGGAVVGDDLKVAKRAGHLWKLHHSCP